MIATNYSTSPTCLNKTVYYQEPGSINFIISSFVFPVVCLTGIAGAIVNLIVLNSKGMKTKTNCFLSSMALADCCFFVVMLLPNFIVYEYLAQSDTFLAMWYITKMPFNALANWLSSLSIWLAVMVTLERLIAIRTPLHAHLVWQRYRPKYVITSICILLFLMQIYTLIHLTPSSLPNCMDRSKTVYSLKRIKLEDNRLLFKFVQYSLMIVPTLTVTLPVVLLVSFNGLLLYYLRSSRSELRRLGSSMTTTKGEWKVTCTVFSIVATLLLFNIPSVIYYWMSTLFGITSKSTSFQLNFLIVVSKALNFLLYCATSSAFRNRLVKIFSRKAKNSLKKSKQSNKDYLLKHLNSNNSNHNRAKALKIRNNSTLGSNTAKSPSAEQHVSNKSHSSDIML